MTPEEKIAKFLFDLRTALREQFDSPFVSNMMVAATPAVVSYYLKGQ